MGKPVRELVEIMMGRALFIRISNYNAGNCDAVFTI
jgi:hypothetical protein